MSHKLKYFLGYGLFDPLTNEFLTHEITGTYSISFTFTEDLSEATCVPLSDIESLKKRMFVGHKIVKIYKTKKSYIFI